MNGMSSAGIVDEGAHHVAVFVFEDVAVVHVAAAVGGEADGDFDDLVGVDADGVLEAALVVVDSWSSSSAGSRPSVIVAVRARSSMPCSAIS